MPADRKRGWVPWLRPDGKTRVSVLYREGEPVEVKTVVVSAQHRDGVGWDEIRRYVAADLVPRALGNWHRGGIDFHVNPTADCGVTARKIIVGPYGGFARHGGGAFSGQDSSKVDRSAAYFCRHVARQVGGAGLARRAEIQVAYAIGEAQTVSVRVDTFGTGDAGKAAEFVGGFDFRPAAIIAWLDLPRPIYRRQTNYGHFGKPDLPWERDQ